MRSPKVGQLLHKMPHPRHRCNACHAENLNLDRSGYCLQPTCQRQEVENARADDEMYKDWAQNAVC